jgi:hypothetical protein
VANKNQEPYILLWQFEKLYEEKYGRKPVINKFRDKIAMKDVIDTVGFDRAQRLIDYYFTLGRDSHKLSFFLFNFDRMDVAEKEHVKDIETRRKLIEATKRMVEEE